MRHTFELRAEHTFEETAEQLFPFFAAAKNLERITPPNLRFEIRTPEPIVMREGLLITYRLRMLGIPMRWQSEITVWDPPTRFTDEQRVGPYRSWIHEHRFEAIPEGTRMTDSVLYSVPGGRLANALIVRSQLRRIFAYRQAVLETIFDGSSATSLDI